LADPNFNNDQHLTDPRSGDAYPDYTNALRTETLGFAGHVVLVHGDGYSFKLDKPLNGPADGVLANFTRVETFGTRNTHWVRRRSIRTTPTCSSFRLASCRPTLAEPGHRKTQNCLSAFFCGCQSF
jgi:hypothetical protein